LKSELATVSDKSFLSEDDLRVATYKGRMIIFPVQRVQMALGARKSWLAQVGEPFPKTWDDFLRTARKFQEIKDAGAVRYGVALQAAKPRDLIHMLDLFMLGSGIRYTVIDPSGKVVIDEPRHAEVLKEFLKVFSTYKLTSPDTINYSFPEMYQVIEGGRAGFFRVGDWNVKKWDSEALKGDFVVGPWPAFKPGDRSAVVIGGMRGVAIPDNSPNKAKAIEFAKFLLSKDAQAASLANVGSAVRGDLPLDGLSERQAWFAKGDHPMIAYDFPESVIPAYPEVEAAYHKALLGALANPPANIDAFIKSTAQDLQKIADAKKS
jgi:multiple sugar transport system substrate-binding protein